MLRRMIYNYQRLGLFPYIHARDCRPILLHLKPIYEYAYFFVLKNKVQNNVNITCDVTILLLYLNNFYITIIFLNCKYSF